MRLAMWRGRGIGRVCLAGLAVACLPSCATTRLRKEVASLRAEVRRLRLLTLETNQRLHKLSDQVFLLEDKVDSNRVALARKAQPAGASAKQSRPRPEPRSRPAGVSRPGPGTAPEDVTEPPRLRVVRLTPKPRARRRPVLRLTGRPQFRPLGGPPIRDRIPVKPLPPMPRFGPGPVASYRRAYALYQKGKYREAARAFDAFLSAHPKHPLADNALFWRGQCEYRLGRYERAAKTYREVLRRYPAGNKTPDALFKLALTYLKLGRTAEARHLLSQVVSIYPGTRLARAAAKYLAQ